LIRGSNAQALRRCIAEAKTKEYLLVMKSMALLILMSLAPMAALAQWGDYQTTDDMALIDDTKQPRHIDAANPGFRITEVEKGSVYEKLGLKVGDLIKTWNGRNIVDAKDAEFIWKDVKESKKFTVVIERDGKKQIFHYTIK
jgi:S1-C subfamily serine protease